MLLRGRGTAQDNGRRFHGVNSVRNSPFPSRAAQRTLALTKIATTGAGLLFSIAATVPNPKNLFSWVRKLPTFLVIGSAKQKPNNHPRQVDRTRCDSRNLEPMWLMPTC